MAENQNKVNSILIIRNDLTTAWESSTYKLKRGELALEYVYVDGVATGKVKMKAGAENSDKTWAELPYIGGDETQVYQSNILPSTNTDDDIGYITNTLVGTNVTPNKGDIAIIKRAIVDVAEGETPDKVSHTAYVYDGEKWAAMDGNYNASNVYFDKDIQVTQSVGNVTTSNNAPVDLKFAGKNMEQIWQYLYATEDKSLSISQPSYSLNVSNTSFSGELGTTFNDPTITLNFYDGSYEYGSIDNEGTAYKDGVDETAGVRWNAATVTATGDKGSDGKYTTKTILEREGGSNTSSSATYTLPDKVNKSADDATKVNRLTTSKRTYTVSSVSSCPESVRKPVTNLGNFIDKDGNITTNYADGTKQTGEIKTTDGAGKKSTTITVNAGWRGWFEGYSDTALDVGSLASTDIRDLAKDTIKGARNGSFSTSMSKVPAGTKQLMFACPTGKINFLLKTDNETIDNDTNKNIVFTVTQSTPPAPWTVKHTTASVADANGENAITYDVFYCTLTNPTTDEQTLSIVYKTK